MTWHPRDLKAPPWRVATRLTLLATAICASIATASQPETNNLEVSEIEIRKTERRYPTSTTVEWKGVDVELTATGAGLREATFMKIDVYTLVSYLGPCPELGADLAQSIIRADCPKQLIFDFRHDVPIEKVREEFQKGLRRNVDDTESIREETETFINLFRKDVREGDRVIYTYLPGRGMTVDFAGDRLGEIPSFEFAQGIWSLYFGREPESKKLRKHLLRRIGREDKP